MSGLLAKIVAQEITEAYDLVESICNRISVARNEELTAKMNEAKDTLFAARVLADEASA